MPIMYSIDSVLGLTLVRWHGLVTAEEFLAHTHKLTTDSHWPPSQCLHLTDLRTATLDESLDEEILLKVAEMYAFHPKVRSFKVAILASVALDKPMIFQRLVEGYMWVIVFYNFSTACMWLDISEEKTDQSLKSLVPH